MVDRVTHTAAELVEQIARSTSLSTGEARRVVADVAAYFSEAVDEYVRRRHQELQLRGGKNEEIFERIRSELAQRPVRAPELTTRQLRRIVYG